MEKKKNTWLWEKYYSILLLIRKAFEIGGKNTLQNKQAKNPKIFNYSFYKIVSCSGSLHKTVFTYESISVLRQVAIHADSSQKKGVIQSWKYDALQIQCSFSLTSLMPESTRNRHKEAWLDLSMVVWCQMCMRLLYRQRYYVACKVAILEIVVQNCGCPFARDNQDM